MRVQILLFCLLTYNFYACTNKSKQTSESQKSSKPYREIVYQYDTLRIACDDISFTATSSLAQRFMNEHKNYVIQIVPSDTSYRYLDKFDLVITSYHTTETNKLAIASDILTLTVNFQHPDIQHLAFYGIKLEKLSEILQGKITNWRQIDKNLNAAPLKFYLFPPYNGGYQQIIKLLQLNERQIKIIPELKEKDILTNIKNVQTGIGFCSHTEAYDLSTKFRKTGIYIVGIDLNNSEYLENEELFWDDIEMLKNAYNNKQLPEGLVRTFYIYASSLNDEATQQFWQYARQHAPSIFEQYGFFKPRK